MELREFQSMGGKARAAKLSSEKKSEIGRKGATVRWAKVVVKRMMGPTVAEQWHQEVRRCQAAHCKNIGKEVTIHGLKAWLCEEHAK